MNPGMIMSAQPSQPGISRAGHSRMRRFLFRLTALVLGLVVAFALAEIGVRIFDPQDLSGTWREITPRGIMANKAAGTSTHQFGSRRVTYQFNEHHLRGGPIGDGKVRVLCLGDSFTF